VTSLEILGTSAGCFTIMAFLPQVCKTYKTKSAKGVSIHMFIIYSISILLWIAYGILLDKQVIYIPNMIIFVLSITQIILKVRYDRREKAITTEKL
jgi:MtN3 and saliva related transmembrane protein